MAKHRSANSASFRWEPKVALGISVLALVGSAIGIKVGHDDRARELSLGVRGEVRNLSKHERAFGRTSEARGDQLLEFRGRLVNVGNITARHVVIEVKQPDDGRLVSGSCRMTLPGGARSRCPDAMDERHLRLSRLDPGQTVTVRFRTRTRVRPCDDYRVQTMFSAWSDGWGVISDSGTGLVSNGKGISCDSSTAALMARMPVRYRSRCQVGDVRDLVGEANAHVRCTRPARHVRVIEHYEYMSDDDVNVVLGRRLAAVGTRRRSCTDGAGNVADRRRSELELGYFCWRDTREKHPGSWIELVDRQHHDYLRAHRDDDDLATLLDWVNRNAP